MNQRLTPCLKGLNCRFVKPIRLLSLMPEIILLPPNKSPLIGIPYTTEAIPVRINDVVVDTTAQGLYDIKPLGQKVPEPQNYWPYVLITALIAIGLLVYFKRSREKKRVS